MNIFTVLILLFVYIVSILVIYEIYKFIAKNAKINPILLRLVFIGIVMLMTIPIIGFLVS